MYNGVCYIININGTKINSKINPKINPKELKNDNNENEYIIINSSDELKELKNEIKSLKKIIEFTKIHENNKNYDEFININDEFTTIN